MVATLTSLIVADWGIDALLSLAVRRATLRARKPLVNRLIEESQTIDSGKSAV